MATDFLRYDLLVQEALRGVVKRVMTDVAREGLPGDHHFFVEFQTQAPGVRLSQALRDRYPERMTIVLQHQFWDLSVSEHAFEVGLSFRGIPERLLIPYEAITAFEDPAVEFRLRFTPVEHEDEEVGEDEMSDAKPAEATPLPQPSKLPTAAPAAAAEKPAEDTPAAPPAPGGGAEVVSLDRFRKK